MKNNGITKQSHHFNHLDALSQERESLSVQYMYHTILLIKAQEEGRAGVKLSLIKALNSCYQHYKKQTQKKILQP